MHRDARGRRARRGRGRRGRSGRGRRGRRRRALRARGARLLLVTTGGGDGGEEDSGRWRGGSCSTCRGKLSHAGQGGRGLATMVRDHVVSSARRRLSRWPGSRPPNSTTIPVSSPGRTRTDTPVWAVDFKSAASPIPPRGSARRERSAPGVDAATKRYHARTHARPHPAPAPSRHRAPLPQRRRRPRRDRLPPGHPHAAEGHGARRQRRPRRAQEAQAHHQQRLGQPAPARRAPLRGPRHGRRGERSPGDHLLPARGVRVADGEAGVRAPRLPPRHAGARGGDHPRALAPVHAPPRREALPARARGPLPRAHRGARHRGAGGVPHGAGRSPSSRRAATSTCSAPPPT